jgi:hypothetical protein
MAQQYTKPGGTLGSEGSDTHELLDAIENVRGFSRLWIGNGENTHTLINANKTAGGIMYYFPQQKQ